MSGSKPVTLASMREDGAFARVVEDKRQPFGSRMAHFDELGFERSSSLIEEFGCNGLAISYDGIAQGKITHHLRPDLTKVAHPEAILELHIGTSGAFSPDFDFALFKRFENVKALLLYGVPMIGRVEGAFPKLEVLRILDWRKNGIRHRAGLWPHLRCLQIPGFRGDLSTLAGWHLRSLFLDHAKLTSFASLRFFPDLETLRADALNADIDLSVLSDLPSLKHLSMKKPRHPPSTAGFASRSLEIMILDKVDHIDLEDFPNLKIYAIDLGRSRSIEKWDGFRSYGDPFAAVHYIRSYPDES